MNQNKNLDMLTQEDPDIFNQIDPNKVTLNLTEYPEDKPGFTISTKTLQLTVITERYDWEIEGKPKHNYKVKVINNSPGNDIKSRYIIAHRTIKTLEQALKNHMAIVNHLKDKGY